MTKTNAAKVSWESLEITGVDNSAVTGEERVKCLREFRKGAGMEGYFFTCGGGEHEDSEDASTWGPESPESVDWSGFPERIVYGIEIKGALGEWSWLNRDNLRFDSKSEAEDWLLESDVEGRVTAI